MLESETFYVNIWSIYFLYLPRLQFILGRSELVWKIVPLPAEGYDAGERNEKSFHVKV